MWRAFDPKEPAACARWIVTEAEIAFVSRDLAWTAKALDAARATFEQHGGAAHAQSVDVRRLPPIVRLDDAERTLAALAPTPLPTAEGLQ